MDRIGRSLAAAVVMSLSGMLMALCVSSPADAARRQYCYAVKTVAPGASTYFDAEQTRCDIVWAAREISIDQPLRSNGGDVLIFAETLRINAPIDTRPYFRTSKVFFTPVTGNFPTYQWNWSQKVIKQTPSVYAQYYYWREVYDEAQKVFTFQVSGGHYDNTDDDRLAAPYEAPQFPAARSPNFANGPFCCGAPPGYHVGPDAPAPNVEAMRSGNVTIVAQRIVFCDTCLEPRPDRQLDPLLADQKDIERRRFIVTAGVKGGLGAAGTQNRCTLEGYCENFDAPAYSGRHSPGGDAGDVTILTYGPASPEALETWRRLTDADGGEPPFLNRVWTRSFARYRQYNNRSNNVFTRLPEATGPDRPMAGRPGQVTLEAEVPVERTLAALQANVASLALVRRYAPDALIAEIRKGVGVDEEVVLPQDVLGRLLLDYRRDIYLTLLQNADVGVAGAQGERAALPHAGLVGGLSCAPVALRALAGDVLAQARALCAIQPVYASAAPERAYLNVSGGLMTPPPAAFEAGRYDSLAVRQRLQKLQDIIAQMSFDTQAVVRLLDENNVREDTKLLQARVEAINARIAELERLNQGGDDPFGAVVSALIGRLQGSLGPRLGQIARDLVTARDNPDGAAGRALAENLQTASAGLLSDLAKTLLPLAKALLDTTETPDNSQALFEARREVSDLMFEIATLQAQAAARREQRLQEASATASNLLIERRALTADYVNAVDGFDTLYKQAIVSGTVQSSDAPAQLTRRLEDVRNYLAAYGKNSIPLTFGAQVSGCQATEFKTLKVKARKAYRTGDCVSVLNRSSTTLRVSVAHPQFGRLVYATLDPGAQKQISLRGLNVARRNGKVELLVEDPAAPATPQGRTPFQGFLRLMGFM